MMQATIKTVLANANFIFTGNHAAAAIAAVRAHKMIDAMGVPVGSSPDTPATRFQIPYSSVVLAQFQYVPDDTEVEDDNCKTRTPAEQPKGLTIKNGYSGTMTFTITLGDTSINGTYGDVTFTNGVASNVQLNMNGILSTTGLPDGTSYTISGNEGLIAVQGSMTGTTPASVGLVYQSN